MAVRLKNIGEDDVDLYHPAGHPSSLLVKAGAVVEVVGALAEDQSEDAHLIGEGDAVRAWPKSRWSIEKSPARASAPAESKES